MSAVLNVLATAARLLTPHTGKRARRRSTPPAISPMASPDYDTNPLERAS